jgi:hypothetical protein
MYNILIIGAGNIGSRHLQAFANASLSMQVHVVDPDKHSLEVAAGRWKEAPNNKNAPVKVDFYTSLDKIKETIDVAIIATSSAIRKKVFEELAGKIKLKYVVFEKFLFQSLEEYKMVDDLMQAHQISAWVNCPRRMYSVYSKIKSLLEGETRFECQITGSNWGLGCNSVHYLDLFSYLSGKNMFEVSDEFIDGEILTSKREGYIEFTGSLFGRDEDNNTFVITSYKKENCPVNIVLNTGSYSILIEEAGVNSKALIINKKKNYESELVNFSMPFQSQLTHQFVETLLKSGNCTLPTYKESRKLHESILSAFLKFLQTHSKNKVITVCPIT